MKRKILLIEDHAQMRGNLCLILELNDYAVTAAENGRIGVELAAASPPDVILCDVMMPELDGYGVTSSPNSAAKPAAPPLSMRWKC